MLRARMFWRLFLSYALLWLGLLVVLGFVLRARDPSAALLLPLAVTGVLSTGTAFLVAWWLSRRVTQPLEELTHAAEHLGTGGFGGKVYAASNDEVGRLSRAFNHMSERLSVQ